MFDAQTDRGNGKTEAYGPKQTCKSAKFWVATFAKDIVEMTSSDMGLSRHMR